MREKIKINFILFFITCFIITGCVSKQGKDVAIAAKYKGQEIKKEDKEFKFNQEDYVILIAAPFEGQNKKIGDSIYNAANLYMTTHNINSNIKIAKFNLDIEEDNYQKISEGLNKYSKINVIIGPVIEKQAILLYDYARSKKINLFVLDNSQNLLNSENAYIFGIVKEDQLQQLIDKWNEKVINKNKSLFYAVLPDNVDGSNISKIIEKNSILFDDTKIFKYDSENSNNTMSDLSNVAKKIHEILLNNKLNDDLNNEIGVGIFFYSPDWKLEKFYNDLNNIDTGMNSKISYLMLDNWKKNNLLSLDHFFIIDSISDIKDSKFKLEFEKEYGSLPNKLSTISYDAMTIIAEGIKYDENTNEWYLEDLKNYSFNGVLGRTKINDNGSISRPIRIYTNE